MEGELRPHVHDTFGLALLECVLHLVAEVVVVCGFSVAPLTGDVQLPRIGRVALFNEDLLGIANGCEDSSS